MHCHSHSQSPWPPPTVALPLCSVALLVSYFTHEPLAWENGSLGLRSQEPWGRLPVNLLVGEGQIEQIGMVSSGRAGCWPRLLCAGAMGRGEAASSSGAAGHFFWPLLAGAVGRSEKSKMKEFGVASSSGGARHLLRLPLAGAMGRGEMHTRWLERPRPGRLWLLAPVVDCPFPQAAMCRSSVCVFGGGGF